MNDSEMKEGSGTSPEEWVVNSQKLRNKSQEVARKKRREEIHLSKGVDASSLQVGDVVYRRRYPNEIMHKLDFKFKGPYKILRNNQNGSYVKVGLDGRERMINRRYLVESSNIKFDFEEGDV